MKIALHHVAVACVVAATFFVYVFTQAPGLYYTDTGELAAAAATWGVAHPTGYPLFTILGHVWCMLPWSSPIQGLAILCALEMALTAGLLVSILRRYTIQFMPSATEHSRVWVSIAGAALFAFSPTAWAQTTAVEVYALQTLLLALTVWSVQRINDDPVRYSGMTALTIGLMLANHISSVFLIPGFLWMWWAAVPSPQRRSLLAWMLPLGALGPALYALLPLRSASAPPINWGMVHRSWDAFVYHVKGTQFGVWMFSDAEAMRTNASTFLQLASHELLWIGWIAAAVGIWMMWRSQRAVALGLALIIVGNLGISFGYAIPDIESYFLPTMMLLAILAALGIARLAEVAKQPRILMSAAVLCAITPLSLNWSALNHRDHHAVEAYTKWTLINVEPNAIVFTRQWDFLCSAFWYLQTVEKYRTDVAMIDKELLRRTWYLPYLEQRYPWLLRDSKQAIQDYMQWLERFEADADLFLANPSNAQQIQARFVALLNSILENHPDRSVYITPELIGEEQGFAEGYDAIPVGPMLLLTRNPTQKTTKMQHLPSLAQSLEGRHSRLDDALRAITLEAVATNAVYAAQFLQQPAKAQQLLSYVEQLDTDGAATRAVRQRIKP